MKTKIAVATAALLTWTISMFGQNITANPTTTQTISQPASTSFNVNRQNNVRYVDQFPGATADVKIINCLNDIPSGGLCNAVGFGATTQTLAGPVTVRSDQTLLFDQATMFQASTPTLNIFQMNVNSHVKGFHFDCDNQAAYSGTVFSIGGGVFGDGNTTSIEDLRITCRADKTAGTGIAYNSNSASQGVFFTTVKDARIWGLNDGILLTSSNGGSVNGNHWTNVEISNSNHGWHFTAAGGSLDGNICSPCSYEQNSTGINAILFDGQTAPPNSISSNVFFGAIWDTLANPPILIANAIAAKNVFIGRFDGTVQDNAGFLNNFWNAAPAGPSTGIASFKGLQARVIGTGSPWDNFDIFDITQGAATPHKYLRVNQGQLQVINSGFSRSLLALTDNGDLSIAGNMIVAGTISKGGGSFKIDHPLDPASKYLSHSFVESPDMKNIYDGVVLLNAKGRAEVVLPSWFEALNQDFRYQLTCIGRSAPVYVAKEISNNRFAIAGGYPGLKVSWQVTGIRHDAFANAHPIAVEEEKEPQERGRYLHPDLFPSPRNAGGASQAAHE